MPRPDTPPAPLSIAGVGLRVVLLCAVVVLAVRGGAALRDWLGMELELAAGGLTNPAVMLAALAHVVLTAIPFVPGAEIGMVMLTLFGAQVAPLVYGCTVLSLALAYEVGTRVPPPVSSRAFRWLGLRRAADMIDRLADLTPEERSRLVLSEGQGLARHLVRYRYVALALVINMPGNIVLGGGGGLALAAGMSGLFSRRLVWLTFLIAVLPVPVSVLLMG